MKQDKIIQILQSQEGAIIGLSDSGRVYFLNEKLEWGLYVESPTYTIRVNEDTGQKEYQVASATI